MMKFACNNIGIKVKPEFSGQIATCSFCNGKVVGHCGAIYIWHWQHKKKELCDVWKEPETEWHREWKSQFPEDWQEVIITKGEKKHIADIFTDNNLVIEFQNSPISQETICIREKFYKKMIWVINAYEFSNNLILEDQYLFKLSKFDIHTQNTQNKILSHNSYEIKELENKINKLIQEISTTKDVVDQSQFLINKFSSKYSDTTDFANDVIHIWKTGRAFIDSDFMEFTNDEYIIHKQKFFKLLGLKKLLDYQSNVEYPERSLADFKEEIDAVSEDIATMTIHLVPEISTVVDRKLLKIETQIVDKTNKLSKLTHLISELQLKLTSLRDETEKFIDISLKLLEIQFHKEKNMIFEQKGSLQLFWKHERKSWRSAVLPIFFDIGDRCLLYRNTPDTVKKISYDQFLNKYRPNGS